MEPNTLPPLPPMPLKPVGPKDERLWGMFCHLSALIALIGIPGAVGPLVIWLIKREEYGLVNDQGRESLNFQLTMLLIYGLAVLALNILTGGSGQFSLGQSAFYAVGAYTTAILIEHVGMASGLDGVEPDRLDPQGRR